MDPVKIIARRIQDDSKQYVDDYWRRKTGEHVDEKKAFKELLENFNRMKNDPFKIREVLDQVAKQKMHSLYNMLLPQKVLDPWIVL